MQTKKHVIFPGWIMVFLATCILTITGNFMTQAGTVSNAAMMKNEATAISRTMFGMAATVYALVKGFPQPLVGQLQDKKGSKFVYRIACIACIVMTFVLGPYANSSGIAFVLIYGIGAGLIYMCSSMIPATGIVNAWFLEKRGPAQTMIQMGTIVAGLVAPKLVNYILKLDGAQWYWGWYVFGVGGIIAFILTFFIKETPEEMGLMVDGKTPDDAAEGTKAEKKATKVRVYVRDLAGLEPFSYKQALRTPAFWLVAIAIVAGTYCNNATQSPGPLLFYDYGWSTDVVTTVMSLRQLVRLVLILGLLKVTNIIEPMKIMGAMLAVNAAALFLCAHPTNLAIIYFFYFSCTITITGYLIMGPLAMSNYFGKKNAGKLVGTMLLMTGTLGSLSSTISGICYDMTGSYVGSFYFFTAVAVIGAICAFVAKPPRKGLPVED